MIILRISVVALLATVLAITIKPVKPEFSLFISVAACVIILLSVSGYLKSVFVVLENLATEIELDLSFSRIILKIVAIAYICEFSSQICKDSGQTAIASKVELAGKILILFISAPVIVGFLEMLLEII